MLFYEAYCTCHNEFSGARNFCYPLLSFQSAFKTVRVFKTDSLYHKSGPAFLLYSAVIFLWYSGVKFYSAIRVFHCKRIIVILSFVINTPFDTRFEAYQMECL